MPTFEDYYAINPISVVDQNLWDDRIPEVIMNFLRGPTIYTPLIDWVDRSQQTGAALSRYSELLEGDTDFDEISMTAQYLPEALGIDSRERELSTARYGDKVQLHDSSGIFQMWRMSGGRDWRPLLRGVLGNNVRRKIELLARNAYLKGPKTFWTYGGGATNFAGIDGTAKFGIEIVNAWNLRLGNTGTPIVPGESAAIKQVILPPGCVYDFMDDLALASNNEAALWRDAKINQGILQYEIGSYKNVRFLEAPNDNYGQNPAILYNAGAIFHQAPVSAAITAGDGAPDPETTKVDETWRVGQKDVTHYIQLGAAADMSKFALNDQVSIHTVRTNAYGVTNGVDFLSGKTIVRRVVSIDVGNKRLAFDRPVMRNYSVDLGAGVYAYVTKAQHIAFNLVLGSRGGIMGNVNRPLKFYEPVAIDDFQSVWRYVWDIIAGYNIWEPNLFECHFTAVSLAKPGGVITPESLETS